MQNGCNTFIHCGSMSARKRPACASCRDSHVTCEGGERPCHRCKVRGWECVESVSKRKCKAQRISGSTDVSGKTLTTTPPRIAGEYGELRKVPKLEISEPPSLCAVLKKDFEIYVEYLRREGIIFDTNVKSKLDTIDQKIVEMKQFTTPQQKEQLLSDFTKQLSIAIEAARNCQVPTIISDRSVVVHYVNDAAASLLSWSHPLPYRDREAWLHIMSPEMLSFLMENSIRINMECIVDRTVYHRASFRSLDCKDRVYRKCNYAISTKRDLLGLPQLTTLQLLPDPE
ncbi:hypothetical protein PROFUN_13194 [Planoprotostelium fungivorum]|uniref:Zn(2)-C6 fungal-type domain-containing protein n=1 Tax=Planoprotostelium fungivorum TaxID=1890364 RepID=A0A2P6N511_9EUKA|nr:hypothetical protein PROFUN_13194 [Planoprotostelium fungivorum]